MENILEVENLSKSYAKSDFTLTDVNFLIAPGSIVGFIGENGAGKSTTMGSILGTLRKDSGLIRAFGVEMHDKNQSVKEEIGVVFDSMNFSPTLTVVQLSKVLGQVYKQWDNERFFHYVDLFSLPKKQKIKSLSRGMSMKLSMAAALSHNAKLLILDEATAGLDPVAREEMLDILLAFTAGKDRSVLLSSHITSDIEQIADHLLFIKKGRVLLQVSKQDLYAHYAIVTLPIRSVHQIDAAYVVARHHKNENIRLLVSDKKSLPSSLQAEKFSIDDVASLLLRGESK